MATRNNRVGKGRTLIIKSRVQPLTGQVRNPAYKRVILKLQNRLTDVNSYAQYLVVKWQTGRVYYSQWGKDPSQRRLRMTEKTGTGRPVPYKWFGFTANWGRQCGWSDQGHAAPNTLRAFCLAPQWLRA